MTEPHFMFLEHIPGNDGIYGIVDGDAQCIRWFEDGADSPHFVEYWAL